MKKGLARADYLMRAPLRLGLHFAKDIGLRFFRPRQPIWASLRADAIFGGMYRDGQVFRPLSGCVASRTPRSMRRWSIRQYRVRRRA